MKRVISVFLAFVIAVSLVSCGSSESDNTEGKVVLGKITSPVPVNNYIVNDYVKDSDYLNGWTKFCDNTNQLNPDGLRLTWKWEGEGRKPDRFIVKTSESPSFKSYFIERTTHYAVKMYNFKTNTKYYWQVSAFIGSKEVKSEVAEFSTADDTVRTLYCPGVDNMRDLGGYKTSDGKTVKQGMIFRCGRLNEDGENKRKIRDSGVDVMERLGIRCELDLRSPGENGITESYIEGAAYYNIPVAGSHVLKEYYEKNTWQMVEIFRVLGNKNNYPMIIHCSAGADRTGFVCYTLNALLGVERENLYKDYLMTNFAFTPTRTSNFVTEDYGNGYDSCEGATLAEKVENHLLSLGVSQDNIDTFKAQMLR